MRESSFSFVQLEWRRLVATCCLSAAVLVTAVLLTRLPAAAGRLSTGWTLATAILVGGLGASAIAALTIGSTRPLTPGSQSLMAVTVNGLTLLSTLATSSHGGPFQLGLACLSSLTVAAACHWWAVVSNPERSFESNFAPAGDAPATVPLTSAINNGHDQSSISNPPSHTLPDHVDQTLSRYTLDGRDHLEACLRVRFEAGQQTAIVHLPIQPAMNFDPEVECELVGDSDTRITVDPAQPYGVRLVCRRSQWNEAGEAILAVLISSDRLARAAA